MQFESLKVFCDVARNRSFSQAAAANHVSQSAASQIVLQLEKRLGVKLIDRSTRPLQLTREGQVYYDGCRGLVAQYLEVEAAVRNLQSEIPVAVQVAAIYSVGLRDMTQYVERFAQQQPHAQVHIEYLHPDRVYEKVLQGTADLGLVSFPRKSRELEAIAWRQEEMVLACAHGHPLAAHPVVRPEQLVGEKFVAFDRGLMIRREVDRFLRDHAVSPEVVLEFDNIENIKKAVEISAGVSLLPRPTLEREIEAGTLAATPLANSGFVRPLGIIIRRNHNRSATVQRFIELLLQPDELARNNGAGAARLAAGRKRQHRSNGMLRPNDGLSRGSRRKGVRKAAGR